MNRDEVIDLIDKEIEVFRKGLVDGLVSLTPPPQEPEPEPQPEPTPEPEPQSEPTPLPKPSGGFEVIMGFARPLAELPDFGNMGSADLYGFGREKKLVDMIYSNSLGLPKCTYRDVPNESAVKAGLLAKFGANYKGDAHLDIECWNSDKNHLAKHLDIIRWAKEALPGARIGYYGVVPTHTHHNVPSMTRDSLGWKTWEAANRLYAPLYEAVDLFLPTCYSRVDNLKVVLADIKARIEMINLIGRGGKPIYIYLNPRFGMSARNVQGEDIGYNNIPEDFFIEKLKLVSSDESRAAGVAGVVVWTEMPWDKFRVRPAWAAIQKFLGFKNP